MATSDSSLAAVIVDVLEAGSVDYAVLHGAERIRAGSVLSDVDVVVGEEPGRLIMRLLSDLTTRDLHPVMDWKYDVGGTRTVFLSRGDASDGIQLDLLFDSAGQGRYGARSDRLLAGRRDVGGVQVLNESDELAYLLAKRIMKSDSGQVEALARTAADTGVSVRVPEVFVPAMASVVVSAIRDGHASPPLRAGRAVRSWVRRLERVYRPTGYCFDVPDRSIARGVRERFSRFIPHVPVDPEPGLSTWIARRRPAVVITSGSRSGAADGVVRGNTVDVVAGDLVLRMKRRTTERLSS